MAGTSEDISHWCCLQGLWTPPFSVWGDGGGTWSTQQSSSALSATAPEFSFGKLPVPRWACSENLPIKGCVIQATSTGFLLLTLI